jgi:hypothetical protein
MWTAGGTQKHRFSLDKGSLHFLPPKGIIEMNGHGRRGKAVASGDFALFYCPLWKVAVAPLFGSKSNGIALPFPVPFAPSNSALLLPRLIVEICRQMSLLHFPFSYRAILLKIEHFGTWGHSFGAIS